MTAALAVDGRTMCRTSPELLQLLAALCAHFGKPYTWPSQETIVQLLRDRYRLAISRRTLNRRLAHLEAAGVIHRIRRHRRDPQLGMTFRSTLYLVTSYGRRLVKKTVDNLSKFLTHIRVPHLAQQLSPIRSLVRRTLQQPPGRRPPDGRNGNAPPPRGRP
jgi:hypothetical protein